MDTHSAPASGPDYFYDPRHAERLGGSDILPRREEHSLLVPYIVFFAMVFCSVAAAATVASEAPMMLVGLY